MGRSLGRIALSVAFASGYARLGCASSALDGDAGSLVGATGGMSGSARAVEGREPAGSTARGGGSGAPAAAGKVSGAGGSSAMTAVSGGSRSVSGQAGTAGAAALEGKGRGQPGGAGRVAAGASSASSAAGRNGDGGHAGHAGSAGVPCPFTGHITYQINKAQSPSAAEQEAYSKIQTGMDKALRYYNCYTEITKSIQVSYVPSVETADGNSNGSLRFGSNPTYMDYRTCMHEIGHTVGIGQAVNWSTFVKDGLFTGSRANAQLQEINDKLAMPGDGKLHADAQHFWPYGINQRSEVKSEADLIAHCQMVGAIRADLGLR